MDLVKWRDSRGMAVERHILTGFAEIDFDAARGIINVVPAVDFESFRVELDMLEPEDQPRLGGTQVKERLDELEIRAWDRDKTGEILREIANRAKGGSQIDETAMKPPTTVDSTFRLFYAPALVLRERRPTAYDEILKSLIEQVERGEGETVGLGTPPWERFLGEGDSDTSGGSLPTIPSSQDHESELKSLSRLYFPQPTNDAQRQIAERHRTSSCVVVKGPPGTGKSHTIANLISHLLAIRLSLLIFKILQLPLEFNDSILGPIKAWPFILPSENSPNTVFQKTLIFAR